MVQQSHSWGYTQTKLQKDTCTPMFRVAYVHSFGYAQ